MMVYTRYHGAIIGISEYHGAIIVIDGFVVHVIYDVAVRNLFG